MNIKEKRNRVIQCLANYCYDVAEDLLQVKSVNTIASVDKQQFCNGVDSIIKAVDSYDWGLEKDSENKYAFFEMDIETFGEFFSDTNHLPSWVMQYCKEHNNMDHLSSYSESIGLQVTEDYEFRIAYCREIYLTDDEGTHQLVKWYRCPGTAQRPHFELEDVFSCISTETKDNT